MHTKNNDKKTAVVTYTYARSCPKADSIQVLVNNEPVFVYKTNVAYFACISFEGEIVVEVETNSPINSAKIRPLSRGITPDINSNRLSFSINRSTNLSIEIDKNLPLFFYANPLETNVPSPNDEGVHYFKAGQVYEVGEFELKDNETLYIEGGAVVRGCIKTHNVKNIKICGRGVFDGSYFKRPFDSRRFMLFEACEQIRIEDIIMIEPSSWMIVLAGCNNAHIYNVKQIGEVITSDGVDIVGTRDVIVEGCFMRNNDDCIVIKAVDDYRNNAKCCWTGNVENILVKDCTFINASGGNAMEIGYELRTEKVSNVTFINCDVLSVDGHGAVFSIHNGDRAIVCDVLFEDIRVEHFFDKFIDFRVLLSRYNKDTQRGYIKNIHFKNIRATQTAFSQGHTVSLIGGYDEEHIIDGVTFEDFYINDQKVTEPDQLDLYIKHTKGIVFK